MAAGIGAYHFAFAPKAPGARVTRPDASPSATDETIAALRRELDALKQARPVGETTGRGAADGLAVLASRIESLEGRLIPASADAGARDLGRLPTGVGEAPATWTEEQIRSFRAMLEEVEVRKVRDRETTAYRDLVRRIAPTIAPADESAATSLVTDFLRKIRGIFRDGSAGTTPEERAATYKQASEERTKLIRDLATVLSKDALEQLSGHLPNFASDAAHTPPTALEPAMDASK